MSVDSHESPILSSNKTKRPPFKLCFAKQREAGRSDAYINKVNAEFITPKFYAREINDIENESAKATAEKIATEANKTPKDVYPWPTLSSHTYGWWHERGIQPKDMRFNHHKHTTDLVSFRMKIYNEDQKLKGNHL